MLNRFEIEKEKHSTKLSVGIKNNIITAIITIVNGSSNTQTASSGYEMNTLKRRRRKRRTEN